MHVIQIGPNESVGARRIGDGPDPNTGVYEILEDPFVADHVAKGDHVVCLERADKIPTLWSDNGRLRLGNDRD